MDPYYTNTNGIPNATGRSFESQNINRWDEPTRNKSLQNILKALYNSKHSDAKRTLKEIRDEIKQEKFYIENDIHKWFDDSVNNGVMWLNAALTVKENSPGSHMDYWTTFMEDLIKYIQKQNHNVAWCLWGKKAQNRFKSFKVDDRCKLLQTVHPRNISFTKEGNPFNDAKLAGINFLLEN